jgi:hypothetical protein
MCWSAEVSLNTFLFALVFFVIALGLNKLPLIILLIALSVSVMQLFEYFVWRNIHNKKIIKYLSIFGPFIILLQLLLINYAFLKGQERIISILLIFAVGIICMIYNYYNNKFDMKVGENGHLIWYWVDVSPLLLLFIFTFYLYPLFKKENKFAFIFTAIFILISLYFYYKYKTWGTMWCYLTNLTWISIFINSIYLYL